MIKHLFVDFTPTTANQWSPATRRALAQRQLPTTLVSNLAPAAILPTIKALNLQGLQIALGGALVFTPTGRVVHESALPRPSFATLLGAVMTYFPTVAVTYTDRHQTYLPTASRLATELCLAGRPWSPAQAAANPAFRCLQVRLIAPDDFLLRPLAKMLVNLHLSGVRISRGPAVAGHPQLLVTSVQATPVAAIRTILRHERLALSDCAKLGNEEIWPGIELAEVTSSAQLATPRQPLALARHATA